ncbi:MAG: hypothetical protein IPN78_12740 [Candidatus Accumulibacter sp.]|nr:hypothetical protein [Candidatus Accumulibacter propinquus]
MCRSVPACWPTPVCLEVEVWRLFRNRYRRFQRPWRAQQPAATRNYEAGATPCCALPTRSRLDRQRLLDASLSGLWKSTSSNVLSGYHQLHQRLAPTAAELDAREATLPGPAQPSTGHVVGFALRQLASIARRLPLALFNADVDHHAALVQPAGQGRTPWPRAETDRPDHAAGRPGETRGAITDAAHAVLFRPCSVVRRVRPRRDSWRPVPDAWDAARVSQWLRVDSEISAHARAQLANLSGAAAVPVAARVVGRE